MPNIFCWMIFLSRELLLHWAWMKSVCVYMLFICARNSKQRGTSGGSQSPGNYMATNELWMSSVTVCYSWLLFCAPACIVFWKCELYLATIFTCQCKDRTLLASNRSNKQSSISTVEVYQSFTSRVRATRFSSYHTSQVTSHASIAPAPFQ